MGRGRCSAPGRAARGRFSVAGRCREGKRFLREKETFPVSPAGRLKAATPKSLLLFPLRQPRNTLEFVISFKWRFHSNRDFI